MKKISGIVLLIMVMLGAVYAKTRPETMTTEQKNKSLVEVALFAIEEGDWAMMAKLYSPKFVQHGSGGSKPTTWTDYELGCRIIHNKFPTLRHQIEDIFAEGDKVAVRLKTVITWNEVTTFNKYRSKGPGKVELTQIDIFRIAGGRIVEEWCELDSREWQSKLRGLR